MDSPFSDFFAEFLRVRSPSWAFGHIVAFCAKLISALFHFIGLYCRWSRSDICVFFISLSWTICKPWGGKRNKCEIYEEMRENAILQIALCSRSLKKTREYFGSKWEETGKCGETRKNAKNAGKWGGGGNWENTDRKKIQPPDNHPLEIPEQVLLFGWIWIGPTTWEVGIEIDDFPKRIPIVAIIQKISLLARIGGNCSAQPVYDLLLVFPKALTDWTN